MSMGFVDFLREAEESLNNVNLEDEGEYSVLGYENGEVDLIPSSAGFVTRGVLYFWDGYWKENVFDKDVEVL